MYNYIISNSNVVEIKIPAKLSNLHSTDFIIPYNQVDRNTIDISYSMPSQGLFSFVVQSTLVKTKSLGLAKLPLFNRNSVVRGPENKESQSRERDLGLHRM